MIPSTTRRFSPNGCLRRPSFDASNGSIRSHCSSLTCRNRETLVTSDPAVWLNLYFLEGRDSAGLVALVEHRLAPRVLAAPLHRHSREDEYSFVLEGRLGVHQHSDETVAEAGDLVVKPRGRWHTFWNAGDGPLRVLEIIVPTGLEQLFKRTGEPGGEYNPDTLPALAAQYGGEVDFERTEEIIRRHSLVL